MYTKTTDFISNGKPTPKLQTLYLMETYTKTTDFTPNGKCTPKLQTLYLMVNLHQNYRLYTQLVNLHLNYIFGTLL